MSTFEGYLFSKLHMIGTKCEGPLYLLQHWDYSENRVIKKTMPWEEDPQLHKNLDKKVAIEGTLGPDGIHYEKISDLSSGPVREMPVMAAEGLEVTLKLLKLEHNVLRVDKQPPQPKLQSMNLTLLVRWPYRSIWQGVCPTTQIYDFFIEKDGNIIWQWSKGKMFGMVVTPVNIPGGEHPREFPVRWDFSSGDIQAEGNYLARAVFIAARKEATQAFEVKFAS